MFDRLYRFSMKNGSRILFGIAILLVAVGVINALLNLGRFGPDYRLQGDWTLAVSQLLSTASYVVMPLFAAVLINRLDHWLSARSTD